MELRRLELSFVVNPEGLLHCRQLQSKISHDQDAGTWHGLNSKILLIDAINPRQRTIIVPMGAVSYTRNDFHVAVDVMNDGSYGKFTVNDTLGRIECPPEPRLLYLKAHFHACTSFVLPDELTGRTGMEEALHCLRSGLCQPWNTLSAQAPFDRLLAIAKLTPVRKYYPKEMRSMQQVFWNPQLPVAVQDDELLEAVRDIHQKLQQLSHFSKGMTGGVALDVEQGSQHLTQRGSLRRHLYQRHSPKTQELSQITDSNYGTRGRFDNSQIRCNVYESVSLIKEWPSYLRTTPDLAGILQSWSAFGGLDGPYDQTLFNSLLDLDFASNWGAILNFCRQCKAEDRFRLMFFFGVVSFGPEVDMDTIRTWIAFAVSQELKSIEPPKWSDYTSFKYDEMPRLSHLTQLIADCRVPYPPDERSLIGTKVDYHMRKRLKAKQREHEEATLRDARAFAQSLLKQWPAHDLVLEEFEQPLMLDKARALELIQPEWVRALHNMELSSYIKKVQAVLDRGRVERSPAPPATIYQSDRVVQARNRTTSPVVSLQHLLGKRLEITEAIFAPAPKPWLKLGDQAGEGEALESIQTAVEVPVDLRVTNEPSDLPREIEELKGVFEELSKAKSTVKKAYGRDMMESLRSLVIVKKDMQPDGDLTLRNALLIKVSRARRAIELAFERLHTAFKANDTSSQWLQAGGLWPCVTPITILEHLRSFSSCSFGPGMRACVLEYAIAITKLQRFLRMENAYLRSNSQRFLQEQRNLGHGKWDPSQYPDWLLMEIDADMLIRADQVDVALATINPPSNTNSVLQMNMGQGMLSFQCLYA